MAGHGCDDSTCVDPDRLRPSHPDSVPMKKMLSPLSTKRRCGVAASLPEASISRFQGVRRRTFKKGEQIANQIWTECSCLYCICHRRSLEKIPRQQSLPRSPPPLQGDPIERFNSTLNNFYKFENHRLAPPAPAQLRLVNPTPEIVNAPKLNEPTPSGPINTLGASRLRPTA
jgi:hypothetical protein